MAITPLFPDQETGIHGVLLGGGANLPSFLRFEAKYYLPLRESGSFQFSVPCSCLWIEESKLISHVENTKTDRCS